MSFTLDAIGCGVLSRLGSALIFSITVFVLASFVGFEIITKVPPQLHTPLMSGSNAISGITVVGAILVAGRGDGTTAAILGFLAVTFATINVVGGFLVTDRMLGMFRRPRPDRRDDQTESSRDGGSS